VLAKGNNIRIVGNYMRFAGDSLDGWNQEKPLWVLDGPFVVEHNVIRDGNWLVDVSGDAEIRYNLLGDSHDRPWLLLEVAADGVQKIHHNVFMRNDPAARVDGVWVLRPAGGGTGAEIYNNTFYGGGACWAGTGPAVRVEGDGFLASLRSNAFVGFANRDADAGIVRGAEGEAATPPPERLGYADYNLFFNPAAAKDNYALAVAGKRERMDPGFALHDAPTGGAVDSQVNDPPFATAADKIPVAFPYRDEDIKAGTVTVCQILAFYRTLFAPAAGSPLIGGGDPADVANNNIGAIGAGDDRFGLLCASGDIGMPDLGAATYTCPKLPPTMMGPGGNGHGFVCVCELAAEPSPGGGAVGALAVLFVLLRRPGRRSHRRKI
jgi:hypothetical protein